MVNCSDLVSRQVISSQEFDNYVDLISERTSFNETLLAECSAAICGALWGYGDTDLAGIGVSPLPNLAIICPRLLKPPPNSNTLIP